MDFRLCGLCVALIVATAPAFAVEQFETRLSPSPLTDGTRINITGEGRAEASLDGRKLSVAVESGLGGGSPVGKPTTLMPGVHHPNNGNAIFVFALPDN